MPTAMPCLAPGFFSTIVPQPWLISSRSFRLIWVGARSAASNSARLLKSTSNACGYVVRASSSGRKKRCWVRPASCSVCMPASVALVISAMVVARCWVSGSAVPDAHFALVGVERVDLVRKDAADRHFLRSQGDEAVAFVEHHRLGRHHVLGH